MLLKTMQAVHQQSRVFIGAVIQYYRFASRWNYFVNSPGTVRLSTYSINVTRSSRPVTGTSGYWHTGKICILLGFYSFGSDLSYQAKQYTSKCLRQKSHTRFQTPAQIYFLQIQYIINIIVPLKGKNVLTCLIFDYNLI